jgi:hypothetical protein
MTLYDKRCQHALVDPRDCNTLGLTKYSHARHTWSDGGEQQVISRVFLRMQSSCAIRSVRLTKDQVALIKDEA